MQNRDKKILVTGAAGFIGFGLCRYLLDKGFTVRALLRNPAQAEKFSQQFSQLPSQHLSQLKRLEHCIGELEDSASLQAACANVDVVVHLAGSAHVNNGSAESLQKVNAEGTESLLNAAVENAVQRFILMSSTLAEAAERNQGDVTAYGRSKLAAEKMLNVAHEKGLIEEVILRPVNVYGPGMKGNIAGMISLIDRGLLPPLPALDNQISLIGVDDLLQALCLAIEQPQAAGKTYTVTDGKSYSIAEIERAIYDSLGRKFPAWRTPHMVLYAAAVSAGWLSRLGQKNGKGGGISVRTYQNLVRDNLFTNEKICQELGFKPAGTLYQALPRIVEALSNKN